MDERIRYTPEPRHRSIPKAALCVALLSASIYVSIRRMSDEFRYIERYGTPFGLRESLDD